MLGRITICLLSGKKQVTIKIQISMLKKILRLFQKRQSLLPLDKADWIVLSSGLAIFAVLSLWTIAKSSVWFDEAFGAYLIRFNFWEIAQYTAADVHPPFYYWLLKIWSFLFGTTEFALRSMSTLFAAVAIFFGFLLTKRLFGRKAAWLSLLFTVLAPMLVRYSQEMRMYTLVSAIALAATYVLTIAMERGKRKYWVIYGILVGLGMWTHYFSALMWLSHWAWRAWVLRKEHKDRKKFKQAFFTKDWVVAHIIAVGFFLPWLPALVYQFVIVQANGFWIPPVTPSTLPNFFTNILYYQDQDGVSPWTTLLLMVVIVSLVVIATRLYRTLNAVQRQNYMLIFTLAFVPIILLFILSMPPVRSTFIDRYLVPASLGISLFIGVTLALSSNIVKPLQRKWLIVLIGGAMIFGIYNVYQLGNYNKTLRNSNNTHQIIEAATAKAKDGEPIIADSPWLFYEAVFYSTANHPVYFIDANTEYKFGSLNMLRDNDQFKIKDLAAFTREHPVVWYLGRPKDNNLTAPDSTWKQQTDVRVNDSVNGRPSYEAIQYKTN